MKFFISLIVLMAVQVVQASELALEPYHNARVIFQSNGATEDYLFALGSYKKISGNWRLDRQQRLNGNLTRYTLELPAGHSANAGFDFYLDQLKNVNLRELFHCTGRDCGTSNSWANNHFKVSLLYGLDQFQRYGAYEVTGADASPFYVALYAVRRGNQRVYMQLDILHLDNANDVAIAANPESIIRALDTNNYYVFPDLLTGSAQSGVSINIKPAHLQVLIDVLQSRPDWTLAIVGHDYAPTTLSNQQKNSKAYAEQLRAALLKAGIQENRLLSYGLGGLAPAGRGDRVGRVELVKISH